MALNLISTVETYSNMIDEAYAKKSHTSFLDKGNIAYDAKTSKFRVQKVESNGGGIKDYDRTNGIQGQQGIKTSFEFLDADIDKGSFIVVDALDERDTLGTAFAGGANILTNKIVKFVDAARIAKISSMAGTKVEETITSAEQAVKAIRAAITQAVNDEIPLESRVLLMTAEMKGLIEDMNLTESRAIEKYFAEIKTVPANILYTAITEGADGFDYKKAEGASDINFLILNKDAIATSFDKMVSVYGPHQIPGFFGHRMDIRGYGLSGYVLDMKQKAVYVNYAPAA